MQRPLSAKCGRIQWVLQLGSETRQGRQPSGDPSFPACKILEEPQIPADKLHGNEDRKLTAEFWVLILLHPVPPSP